MASLHDVKTHSFSEKSLLPQEELTDEERLAYHQSRRQSARVARLRALLGIAVAIVVLYLSGRKVIG